MLPCSWCLWLSLEDIIDLTVSLTKLERYRKKFECTFNLKHYKIEDNICIPLYISFYFVITKTGNDYKRPQTTSKRPQTTSKRPQTTTNGHKPRANDHKLPPNDQKRSPLHTNQKADVSFLLAAPGNYNDHLNIEKHRQSVKGNCLLLSQYLRGAN